MPDQPARIPLSEIADRLHKRHANTAANILEDNRRRVEEVRSALRDIAVGFQARLAEALSLDPHQFSQVPDDVFDSWINARVTVKALSGVADAKVNIDLTSVVKINGVPVPDDE